MVVHVQSLPPTLRGQVISHLMFRDALTASAESDDAAWLRRRALVLRANAVQGLTLVGYSQRLRRQRPPRERHHWSAQTRLLALEALASACGATILDWRASLLSAGSDIALEEILECFVHGPVAARRRMALARARLVEPPRDRTIADALARTLTARPTQTHS